MKKVEFIKKVAKKSGHTEKECNNVFNAVCETIQETLYKGIDIKISNFMNLILKTSDAREMNNPRNGEKIKIPKRYKVRVTLPRHFLDKMKTKTVY